MEERSRKEGKKGSSENAEVYKHPFPMQDQKWLCSVERGENQCLIQIRKKQDGRTRLRRAHVPRRLQAHGEVVACADDMVGDARHAVGARPGVSRVGGRPAATAAQRPRVADASAVAKARRRGKVEGREGGRVAKGVAGNHLLDQGSHDALRLSSDGTEDLRAGHDGKVVKRRSEWDMAARSKVEFLSTTRAARAGGSKA